MPTRRLFDGASIEIGALPIEGANAVSATLTKTLNNLTLASVGQVGNDINGQVQKSLDSITLTSAASIVGGINATLSETLGAITVEAVGEVFGGAPIDANLIKTLENIGLTCIGQIGEIAPDKIYQEIWIIEEEEKKNPRKPRRAIKKLKKQLKETVLTIETVQKIQERQEPLKKQQEALQLAEQKLAISFQLLELQIKSNELDRANEAYQAKGRLKEYLEQKYEKVVKLYQEERQKKEQEENEDLQLLFNYLMQEL